jgi:hypothetical protein
MKLHVNMKFIIKYRSKLKYICRNIFNIPNWFLTCWKAHSNYANRKGQAAEPITARVAESKGQSHYAITLLRDESLITVGVGDCGAELATRITNR